MSDVAVMVARLDDLTDPGAREFFVGDGDWPFRGFLVQVDGSLRAYANVCPHKQHPLNLADDDFLVPGQKLLRCASHNALFVPESGLCVFGPCAGRSLTSLQCWVENGAAFVRVPVPTSVGAPTGATGIDKNRAD